MKQTLAALLVVFFAFSLNAQTETASIEITNTDNENLVELETNDWTFYSDEDNRVLFIDFDNIDFNLSDIVVKNTDGEVLLKDDVLNLPVDTIYELDFSAFNSGIYQVELRSFTGVIKKEVALK